MRNLRTGLEGVWTLSPLATEDFRRLDELNVRPAVYFRPWKDNLASVDAVAVLGPGGPAPACLLLQMTVAERHPLKAAGVEALLQRLPAGAAPVLVLAVPEDVFASVKAGGFEGLDGRLLPPRARVDALTALPQFALVVSVTAWPM